jgi:cell division protein FtsZ
MTTGNSDYSFSMVEDGPTTRLVVLGVGGMGNNAMENLARAGVPGLELYSLNTDVQALRRCNGSKPVQLGAKRTGGKGAGGNSDIGRMSAEDDTDKIRKLVTGAEMVFIASGMGGGTGSGAAPVVAQVCRELGVLCVCVVTMPMQCEGPRRGEKGRIGLVELSKKVDSLLIIENEKLSAVMDQEDVSIIEVFRKADKVVVDIVTSISRVINSHGYINLDLADLKNVLKRGDNGACVEAYIGLGEATGSDRAKIASEIALNNPLLRTTNIQGAANLLVNVAGSEDIGHKEAMIAVNNVVERVGSENREIFIGVVTDNSMGDRLSVTVIATGLPSRGTSVVKIKQVERNNREIFPRQNRNEIYAENIPIKQLITDEVETRVVDQEVVVTENYLPDISGFSPLVRKDEWHIPTYIRTQTKAPELVEQPSESRVRNISTNTKTVEIQSNQVVDKGQFRQPLYNMAG